MKSRGPYRKVGQLTMELDLIKKTSRADRRRQRELLITGTRPALSDEVAKLLMTKGRV